MLAGKGMQSPHETEEAGLFWMGWDGTVQDGTQRTRSSETRSIARIPIPIGFDWITSFYICCIVMFHCHPVHEAEGTFLFPAPAPQQFDLPAIPTKQ
mmetsp:Transcript_9142/g.27196  ORF Transcript_9142/g.27196 Transcript_9142/m.27196 type:complete len:97 (-) Transcript_9142:528-818(-)